MSNGDPSFKPIFKSREDVLREWGDTPGHIEVLEETNKTVVNFTLEIGARVYDAARMQNGVVIARRYTELKGHKAIAYEVCYNNSGSAEYEWNNAGWLTEGHKIE